MTIFRGSRHEGGDYFDDMLGDNSQAGVFEGAGGLGGYENIKETLTKDGLRIQMSCRKCNREALVTVEWPELFIIASNGPTVPLIKPRGWAYSQNNGMLYPENVLCTKDGEPLCPQLSPDEARAHVNAAVSRGLISMAQASAWRAEVAQYQAQAR